MARKLDKKVIQTRIKDNKKIMKEYKAVVTASMNAATKGEDFDAKGTRHALTEFLKAATAVKTDSTKLESIDNAE